MKIRILDRILVFLAGIVLIAAGAGVIAEHFFAVPVLQTLTSLLAAQDTATIAIYCGVAAVLVLLGIYCVGMLFRHKKGKRGFVLQHTEGGELSISIKAIENLVQKCIDKHEELHVLSTSLENSRDGLVIKLRIGLANGVSIPLVVSALQKQIKQYITACTGVDVREVKVQVETASAKLKDSPFAVPEMLANPTADKLASTTQEPAPVHAPVTVVPPETTEKEAKRPLHQRLFGREEQSMNVPEPPKEEAAPEKESTPEKAEEQVTEAPAANEAAEEAKTEAEMKAETAEEAEEAFERTEIDEYELPVDEDELTTEEVPHEAAQ